MAYYMSIFGFFWTLDLRFFNNSRIKGSSNSPKNSDTTTRTPDFIK